MASFIDGRGHGCDQGEGVPGDMRSLTVIGVEDGVLIVAGERGERFRVTVDGDVQAQLREIDVDSGRGRRLPPREIQAHIRAGMTAEQVAQVTGAGLDSVRRYEAPVLAERQYVVDSARAVSSPSPEGSDATTFGGCVDERLEAAGATDVQWSSWKEPEDGWVVKAAFRAEDAEHDARWHFDPKRRTLSPANVEGLALWRRDDVDGAVLERLRALDAATATAATTDAEGVATEPVATIDNVIDMSRFDSAVFRFPAGLGDAVPADLPTAPVRTLRPPTAQEEDEFDDGFAEAFPGIDLAETADLLEALRRRRGEREGLLPAELDEDGADPATAPLHRLAAEERLDDEAAGARETGPYQPQGNPFHAAPPFGNAPRPRPAPPKPAPKGAQNDRTAEDGAAKRRGRATMPTWDEIMFGAKPDDGR